MAGSGLHENGLRTVEMVAMQKESEATLMQKPGFGERERLAHKASQALS
jgi:hypothetical protein